MQLAENIQLLQNGVHSQNYGQYFIDQSGYGGHGGGYRANEYSGILEGDWRSLRKGLKLEMTKSDAED